MRKSIINFFKGIFIGIANIIPGVSGGTIAVMLGVFDELITAINTMFKNFKKNLLFLLPIALGAIAAIFSLSRFLEWSLENHSFPTTYFFIGLVAGSIPMIFKKVKKAKFKIGYAIGLIISVAIVIILSLFANKIEGNIEVRLSTNNGVTSKELPKQPTTLEIIGGNDTYSLDTIDKDKVSIQLSSKNAKDSKELSVDKITLDMKYEGEELVAINAIVSVHDLKKDVTISSLVVHFNGKLMGITSDFITVETPKDEKFDLVLAIKLFFGGAIAAAAMVVPGISGSFLMMILGLYTTVLGIISNLNILLILFLGAGCAIGILVIAKLIEILYKKAFNLTYYCILGLIFGSLVSLVISGSTYASGISILSGIVAAITFASGLLLALFFGKE